MTDAILWVLHCREIEQSHKGENLMIIRRGKNCYMGINIDAALRYVEELFLMSLAAMITGIRNKCISWQQV